jgi:hypothetical protein
MWSSPFVDFGETGTKAHNDEYHRYLVSMGRIDCGLYLGELFLLLLKPAKDAWLNVHDQEC